LSGRQGRRRRSFSPPRIRVAPRLIKGVQLSGFESASSKRNVQSKSERSVRPREKNGKLLVKPNREGLRSRQKKERLLVRPNKRGLRQKKERPLGRSN